MKAHCNVCGAEMREEYERGAIYWCPDHSPPPEPVENRDSSVSQSGVSGQESGGEEERWGWNRQLSHASEVWVLRSEAEANFDAFLEGQQEALAEMQWERDAARSEVSSLTEKLRAAEEEASRLRSMMNEIDIVMNWNADVCCRCFTNEHPGRNPNCQYHRVEEITRAALSPVAAEEGGEKDA